MCAFWLKSVVSRFTQLLFTSLHHFDTLILFICFSRWTCWHFPSPPPPNVVVWFALSMSQQTSWWRVAELQSEFIAIVGITTNITNIKRTMEANESWAFPLDFGRSHIEAGEGNDHCQTRMKVSDRVEHTRAGVQYATSYQIFRIQ